VTIVRLGPTSGQFLVGTLWGVALGIAILIVVSVII
jgi:hypothetical protein